MRWALPSSAALFVLSCREPAAPQPSPTAEPEPIATAEPTPPQDPAEQFADLETRLLSAKTLRVTFDITAEGSNTANLRGVLELAADGKARIDARGTFAGEPGEVHFTSDGRTMKGERGGKRFELPTGKALQESIVLGMTRMGLLHNLAVLWGGRPPDLADGGIREWVMAIDHADASNDERGNALGFRISVQGTPMGETMLELDGAGWPTQRSQTVHFPNGDMTVVERYEAFEVIAPAAPATTARPP
jgi:hypothetical protein